MPVGTKISGKDIVAALSESFKSKNSGVVKELQKILSITNQNGLIKINSNARIDLGTPGQYILIDNGATLKISMTSSVITILSASGITGSESLKPGLFNSAGLQSGTLSKSGDVYLKLGKGQSTNLKLNDLFD